MLYMLLFQIKNYLYDFSILFVPSYWTAYVPLPQPSCSSDGYLQLCRISTSTFFRPFHLDQHIIPPVSILPFITSPFSPLLLTWRDVVQIYKTARTISSIPRTFSVPDDQTMRMICWPGRKINCPIQFISEGSSGLWFWLFIFLASVPLPLKWFHGK